MKIKNLHLTNFKGIEDTFFDFEDKKIIGVTGANGSNKSSILQAIEIMLLGKSKKANLEDFIGNNGESYTIESEFEHEGLQYTFEATYAGSMKKVLSVGNDSYKNSAVTAYLNEMIDPKLALYSSFSFQGDSTSILEQDNAERLEYMKKILLNEEEFKDKEKKLSDIITQTQDKIKKIETEIELLNREAVVYETELLFVDNREELRLLISNIDIKKQEQTQKLKDYDTALQQYKVDQQVYQSESKKYRESLNSYQNEISEIENSYNRLYEVYSAYEIKKAEYDAYISKKSRYDSDKLELETEIAGYDVTALALCKYALQDIKDAANNIIQAKTNLAKIVSDMELAIAGKCPKCGKEFHGQGIEQYEKAKLEAEQTIVNLETEKDNIQKEIDNYNRLEQKLNNNISLKKLSERKLAALVVPVVVDMPTPARKPIKKDYPVKPVFTQIEPIMPQVVEQKNFDKEVFDLEKKILEIENKIKQNIEIQSRNAKVKEKENLINSQKDTKAKEREDLLISQDSLTKALKILRKDLPVYIIDKGISQIRNQTNKFFKQVYNKFSIDIKPIQNSLAIFYHDEDKVRNASLASGAEKQIISMAFRVALCSLQDVGLFIIDEADSEADDDRSLELIENLCGLDFEQVIIITHKNPTKALIEELPDSKVFLMENGKIVDFVE